MSSSRLRGSGSVTLAEAERVAPATGPGGFSGTYPRVQRSPTAADAPAPDTEQRLAAALLELGEARRQRDQLEQQLTLALDELSDLRPTAQPPPPIANTEAEKQVTPEPHRSAELSRLFVSTRPAAPEDDLDDSRPSTAERRNRERRACEFEVEFLGDSHFIVGMTEDLSEGGVFVATYKTLPIGTPVGLAFELPHGRRIEARGEVRWTRAEGTESETRPGLGIAFTELSAECLATIREFCGSLQVRYYEF